ncbi:MAG: rRNA maturation RNase YbeY [Micropruina glycogenica]
MPVDETSAWWPWPCSGSGRALRIHPQAELSVLLVDEPTMAAYPREVHGRARPTDVLSFPMDEAPPATAKSHPPGVLGGIDACADGHRGPGGRLEPHPRRQADCLLIHGLLRLLGHDHAEL